MPPLVIVLAAAAVVVTAAAVAAAQERTAAAVAQDEDQNDDPANVTAAETVVVAHNIYLQEFFSDISRSFQDIPQHKKGASATVPFSKFVKFLFDEQVIKTHVIANQCAHWCGNLLEQGWFLRLPRRFAPRNDTVFDSLCV